MMNCKESQVHSLRSEMNINRVFAENNINISAQSLMTNESIGYLVMDVDKEYSTVALEKLQHIDGTIRTRVLY